MTTSALDSQKSLSLAGETDEPLRRVFVRIVRSTVYFVFAQIGARIVGFAYILILARWLPINEFGYLNLVLTIIVLADTAADLGLSRLVVRQLSQDATQAPRYLGALVPFRILTSCLAYAAVLTLIWLTGYPTEILILASIAGAGLLFTGPTMLLEAALHSHQRFFFVSVAHIALSLVQASTGAAILFLGGGTADIATTFALANLIYLAIVYCGISRLNISIRPTVDLEFWFDRLRSALPYGAIAIIIVLSMRLELLVLGWFGSAVALGHFGVAARFLEAGLLVSITFGTVLAPSFARYHMASRAKLANFYLLAMRIALVLAIPAALAAVALARPIMNALLGSHDVVGELLRIMLTAYPFGAIYYVNLSLMFGARRQYRTLLMTLGLALLQFSFSYLLIPIYGAHGAAVAFGISSLLAAMISTGCILRWFLPGAPVMRALAPPLTAGLIMAAMVFQLPYVLGAWAMPLALSAYVGIVAGLLALLPLRLEDVIGNADQPQRDGS